MSRAEAQISDSQTGHGVLESPILRRHATSQSADLPNDDYAAGLAGIEEATSVSEVVGEALTFLSRSA